MDYPEPSAPLPAPRTGAATSAGAVAVEVNQLTRRFGEVTALEEVCLCVRRGEFFSLLGPSGCGKTSLLRIVAGLDWPDSGSVRLGAQNALELPAHRRPVNTVFQSYALFPHLTVRGNIAFGLQMKRVPKAECVGRVDAAMALARIADLAERRPAQLSGGQKQRVALARALVNEPEVLLLDEPLGALDLQLRRQLQVELKALQRHLGITFIHVTHDQEEALALSDRVAVMNAGRVEQVGTPREVYDHPRTRFVALFLGSCNLIEARLPPRPAGTHCEVHTSFGSLKLSPATGLPARDSVTLAIRPERIGVAEGHRSGAETRGVNRVAGTVRETLFAGSETQYTIDVAGQVLRVRIPSSPEGLPGWLAGEQVEVYLPAGALTVLED